MRQGPSEPVGDHIAAMQAVAIRVSMSYSSWADAIIQGLYLEIRPDLHVSYSGAEAIEEILEAARISEAAYPANLT
jgi:hypothetical protein